MIACGGGSKSAEPNNADGGGRTAGSEGRGDEVCVGIGEGEKEKGRKKYFFFSFGTEKKLLK